jgi:hypothetical protein
VAGKERGAWTGDTWRTVDRRLISLITRRAGGSLDDADFDCSMIGDGAGCEAPSTDSASGAEEDSDARATDDDELDGRVMIRALSSHDCMDDTVGFGCTEQLLQCDGEHASVPISLADICNCKY